MAQWKLRVIRKDEQHSSHEQQNTRINRSKGQPNRLYKIEGRIANNRKRHNAVMMERIHERTISQWLRSTYNTIISGRIRNIKDWITIDTEQAEYGENSRISWYRNGDDLSLKWFWNGQNHWSDKRNIR